MNLYKDEFVWGFLPAETRKQPWNHVKTC